MAAEDFNPDADTAMRVYRTAWLSFLLSRSFGQASIAGDCGSMMDSMQESIASSPADPRWLAFTKSLPGFDKFWGEAAAKMRTEVLEAVKKKP